jgi:hypothetical protein
MDRLQVAGNEKWYGMRGDAALAVYAYSCSKKDVVGEMWWSRFFFGVGFYVVSFGDPLGTSIRDLVPQWTTRIEIEVTMGKTASVFFNTDIEINLWV